jgi:TusE/DsrC/DsvC family sulfur relay protein
MATKTYAGQTVEVNDEGFFLQTDQWTKEMAPEIAKEVGIDALDDRHYAVIDYIRDKVAADEQLTMRGMGKSGVVTLKDFYQLFPGKPLKYATRIAGVPKPTSCV